MESPGSPAVARSQPKLKVLRLRHKNPGRFIHTITQEMKLEAVMLAREITQSKKAYVKHMHMLETAFRSGAADEPGEYVIEDILRRGGGVFVEKWEKPGIRIAKKKAG